MHRVPEKIELQLQMIENKGVDHERMQEGFSAGDIPQTDDSHSRNPAAESEVDWSRRLSSTAGAAS